MKAILVIDMPTSCGECKFADFGKCWGSTSYIHMSTNSRPKECPLKPMPQKREPNEEWLNEYHRDEFADGWNACLEEIEK